MLTSYRAAWVLTAAVLLLANVRLLTGDAVPRWDAAGFFAPAYSLVADAARAGRQVLWNPWVSGGAPDAADPQLGAYSPVTAALGLVLGPGLRGFAVYWLLIWWWGAAGVLLLARHLRAPAWGAAIAAVGFACSGFYVGHAQHTAILVSMSWLPFSVWRLDVALKSGSPGAAAQAGALWGLSALSGYPALTVLSGGYLALWSLGHAVRGKFSRAAFMRAVAMLLLATVIGLVVLSPAYWAFFREGRGYSDRAESLSRQLATGSNALHPGALATFASPYVAVLDLLDEELWPYTESSSGSIYLPAAVLVLALLALVRARSEPWRLYLAVVAALMLGCALGQALPLRGWLYDLFLPLRYFRHAVVFRGYYLFTAVVLALLAARDLAAGPRRLWRRCAGLGLAAAAGAASALGITGWRAEISGSHFLLACAIAVALWLGCAAAAWWGIRRRSAAIGVLVVLACVDGAAAIRMPRYFVIAWDRETLELWRQVEEARESRFDLLESGWRRQVRSRFGADPNNRNVMAREPVLESHVGLRSSFHGRWLGSQALTAAVTGERRFYFAAEAVEAAWTHGAFSAFADRAEELGALPFVVHGRGEVLSGESAGEGGLELAEAPPARPADVELLRYEPEALALRLTAPEAGYLLVADRFARGWRATVDGERAEVVPACFLFRAVAVPEGTSRVVMEYRPAGHPWLVVVSWATLAFVGALWMTPGSPCTPRAPPPRAATTTTASSRASRPGASPTGSPSTAPAPRRSAPGWPRATSPTTTGSTPSSCCARPSASSSPSRGGGAPSAIRAGGRGAVPPADAGVTLDVHEYPDNWYASIYW